MQKLLRKPTDCIRDGRRHKDAVAEKLDRAVHRRSLSTRFGQRLRFLADDDGQCDRLLDTVGKTVHSKLSAIDLKVGLQSKTAIVDGNGRRNLDFLGFRQKRQVSGDFDRAWILARLDTLAYEFRFRILARVKKVGRVQVPRQVAKLSPEGFRIDFDGY